MSEELRVISKEDKYNNVSLKKSLAIRRLFITRFLLAFQLLTIMPLKVKGNVSEKELAQSAAFFPAVGAFQGLLALLSALLLSKALPSEIVSGLIILILTISNGGFHLDGLADTFDALAVKSSGNEAIAREKRLSVMKDSAAGAIGVTAIALAILLKFLLIKNLLAPYPLPLFPYFILFLMPVFSRWSMVPAIFHGKSARQDGLGKIFIDNTGTKEFLLSTTLAVGIWLFVLSFTLPLLGHLPLLLLSLFVLYIFSFSATRFFDKKFNGLTGDNIGAISEISEILFLLAASIWLQHFI
jgi:adenosylcobinamide-GDP ribazoletransferase